MKMLTWMPLRGRVALCYKEEKYHCCGDKPKTYTREPVGSPKRTLLYKTSLRGSIPRDLLIIFCLPCVGKLKFMISMSKIQ
jgi:hypothetical protein